MQIIPRKAIKITNADLKIRGYKLHTNEKTYIGKIAKGFDFCEFRLFYDKILLAKTCLDNFEKCLSMLYEQLLINRNSIYKNKFINTVSIKSIKQYVLRFKCWAKSLVNNSYPLYYELYPCPESIHALHGIP